MVLPEGGQKMAAVKGGTFQNNSPVGSAGQPTEGAKRMGAIQRRMAMNKKNRRQDMPKPDGRGK